MSNLALKDQWETHKIDVDYYEMLAMLAPYYKCRIMKETRKGRRRMEYMQKINPFKRYDAIKKAGC